MSEWDRASCRRAAAECIELARIATDPDTKQILLTRGQEWLKLAYSDHDAEFERLLTQFNAEQMGFFDRMRPPDGTMQPQAVQQQQSKLESDDKI